MANLIHALAQLALLQLMFVQHANCVAGSIGKLRLGCSPIALRSALAPQLLQASFVCAGPFLLDLVLFSSTVHWHDTMSALFIPQACSILMPCCHHALGSREMPFLSICAALTCRRVHLSILGGCACGVNQGVGPLG